MSLARRGYEEECGRDFSFPRLPNSVLLFSMTFSLPKVLLASITLLSLSSLSTQAAIIFTLPTATTAGSIQITNDVNFTITAGGSVGSLVFDEWVTSDGLENILGAVSIAPSGLSYSVNGGATSTVPMTAFNDNAAQIFSSVTPNDGYLFFPTGFSASLGNVVTIKAATYTLAAGSAPSGFNPQANQTFTGKAFLASNVGIALSGLTPVGAVPEPSNALLLIGGLGALLFRRRKA